MMTRPCLKKSKSRPRFPLLDPTLTTNQPRPPNASVMMTRFVAPIHYPDCIRETDDRPQSPEPSNKRLKSTVADEASMTSSQEGFVKSSHVDDTQEAVAIPSRDDDPQEGVAASSKDDAAQGAIVSSSTDNIGVPPASPRNSLFGDGSDSEDILLASKASMPPPAVSQITKEQTQTATQPSMSPETQIKEKSKIPLHRQRKQNPRVKQMDIPLLNTKLGGISTKTRILSQNSAKSAGPSLPKTSMRENASGPSLGVGASPTLMDSPDLTTPDLDATNWLKENISSKCGFS